MSGCKQECRIVSGMRHESKMRQHNKERRGFINKLNLKTKQEKPKMASSNFHRHACIHCIVILLVNLGGHDTVVSAVIFCCSPIVGHLLPFPCNTVVWHRTQASSTPDMETRSSGTKLGNTFQNRFDIKIKHNAFQFISPAVVSAVFLCSIFPIMLSDHGASWAVA